MSEPVIAASAVVHPSAMIGDGTVIEDFVYVGPNVSIGDRCLIKSGCRIGSRPFDRSVGRDSGQGVDDLHPIVIGSNCILGNNTVVQYGVKHQTSVGPGSWINNLCNIGHDVSIGEDAQVGMSTSISGHSVVGDGVRIGPGCTVNNRSLIGAGATIGIGSLILHEVPAGTVVLGRPAVERDEYLSHQKAVRELIGDNRDSRRVTTHAKSGQNKLIRAIKAFVRVFRY